MKSSTTRHAKREIEKFELKASDVKEQNFEQKYAIWYDATNLSEDMLVNLLSGIRAAGYTGIVLSSDIEIQMLEIIPANFLRVFQVSTHSEFESVRTKLTKGDVVVSSDPEILTLAKQEQVPTCLKFHVDSNQALHAAIASGKQHAYLCVHFRDPTNIPLELVIASLQSSGTVLINEIQRPEVEAAVVALGVMEVGADGVMYSPRDLNQIQEFGKALAKDITQNLDIVSATVIRAEAIGMGYRSCIDLTTIFQPDEGMLIGSTSHGGILCCPEVFHLPYMELRPFRVNAGAVHSYVYGPHDQTNYLTELKAGSEALIVGLDGQTRRAAVGRIKTEMRPLRLIEVETDDGTRINTIMQDDWHVRVYSADGKPFNITEIKPGDKVLAMAAKAGRHVGIAIDERILEN